MVRAEHGLTEIGLDLTPEYNELESQLTINPDSKGEMETTKPKNV